MSLLKSIARIDETYNRASTNDFLTYEDCIAICIKCLAESARLLTLMNISIVDESGKQKFFFKEAGAWDGSIDIAEGKAYTAFAFSGDKDKQGPLTTETLGTLAQPGKPLYGIQNTSFRITAM